MTTAVYTLARTAFGIYWHPTKYPAHTNDDILWPMKVESYELLSLKRSGVREQWNGCYICVISCGASRQSYVCGMAGSTWLSSLTSPLRKGSDEWTLNAVHCYYPWIILQFLPTNRLVLLKAILFWIVLEHFASKHKSIKWWQINLAEMIFLFN